MSNPSSVVHYTSLEVLNTILREALLNDGIFTMHLSHLTMMNDFGEGGFVLDKFFRNSKKKIKMKDEWDCEFYPQNMPFILSMIRATSKDGVLPMWKMYGDNLQGAFIKFDFKCLSDFCAKKKLIFSQAKYSTCAAVGKIISQFNRENTDFRRILIEACLTKQICWQYENEWRIIALCCQNCVKTKVTSRGAVNYVEMKFPLNLIKSICLGPKVDSEISLQSFELLKNQLVDKFPDQVQFKITKSSIKIR